MASDILYCWNITYHRKLHMISSSRPNPLGSCGPGGGGVLPYITYTGMCRPTGSWFWSSWFRTGYPFQRRFLERGIVFRTHESSSFVSSHLKLLKDRLLLKIRFNALTSKLLYSCCTLCFKIVADYEETFIWCISRTNKGISFQKNRAISICKLSRTEYKKLAHL